MLTEELFKDAEKYNTPKEKNKALYGIILGNVLDKNIESIKRVEGELSGWFFKYK